MQKNKKNAIISGLAGIGLFAFASLNGVVAGCICNEGLKNLRTPFKGVLEDFVKSEFTVGLTYAMMLPFLVGSFKAFGNAAKQLQEEDTEARDEENGDEYAPRRVGVDVSAVNAAIDAAGDDWDE